MPWSRDDITRLIEVEAQLQGVDPRLAVAVAQQESSLDPNNPGDNGASRGVFHLQRKAAIDAGIDPAKRDDPAIGIFGGVKYLKQQLDRSKGHIPTALSYYNRGTPEYRGIGDPDYVYHVMRHYPEHPLGKAPEDQAAYRARLNKTFGTGTAPEEPRQQPGIMARIGTALSPGSAEAATPQAAPRSRLEEIEAELARREGQTAPPAPTPAPALPAAPATQPSPPTARSTPEQDAAYRASRGTQAPPPVSQAAPPTTTQPRPQEEAKTPDTSWTPGMRFQALPSIQQLEPGDRAQKTKLFESLDPTSQEEFLRSEEPQGQRSPALPAPAGPPGAQMEGNVLSDRSQVAEGGPQVPLSTAVPAALRETAAMGIDVLGASGGAAVGAATSPVTGPVGPLVGGALGGGLATRVNTALGLRPQETPFVQTPYVNLYPSDVLNIGIGGLASIPPVVSSALKRSQAGKALVAADEATTLARQEWQQATATAKAEQAAGRAEAYQAAERRARDAQVRYQTKVEARDALIAANEQTYQEALAASKAEGQAEQARRYGQARAETMEETASAQARQQQYQQAVTGQGQAITQARAVPGRYTPETPSWVLYEKFGDAAKDAVVDLTPAKAALAEVRASRGVLPDGTARPLPAAVESIAANLEKATGETSFKIIREELRRLGPLTRSQDGNVRGAAKQLYGIYADVLETSPLANDLLRNANATFRKEMALQDVQEWLRPGHGVVRIDQQGRQTINVGTLLTRLEKEIGDSSLFRGAFAPDELQALRQDFGRLAGTPTMPRGGMPPAATPELLPGAAPNIPASMQSPTPKAFPPEVPRPRVEQLPGGAGPGRRVAVAGPEPTPTTPRQALGERPKFLGPRAGEWGAILVTLQALGIPTAPLAAAAAVRVTERQGRWLLAHALLSDKGQKVVRAAVDGRGTLNPRTYGALVAILSPEEKQAYERETRAQGR